MDSEGKKLEQEILSIARQLWPSAEGGGSTTVDGSEKDGVYITEEMVHLVECTISRGLAKAKSDIESLKKLIDKYRRDYPEKGVKGYFITKDEPTGEQRSAIPAAYLNSIIPSSFSNFQAKLINVSSYLGHRENHYFGSIKDPLSGSDNKFSYDFIPVQLTAQDTLDVFSVKNIHERLMAGAKIVVLGQYGVGKSVTLKEVFKKSATGYRKSITSKFCIYLNLREHHGQDNPVEVLERHARNIAFPYPTHLVRAWKSGYASIILDGFDEIPSLGWSDKTAKLKDVRYKAMKLIRAFVQHTPSQSGLLISGRNNFFDSVNECKQAFTLDKSSLFLSLDDFNEEQTKLYISRLLKAESIVNIPDWFPSKPLLLGYLVKHGLVTETILKNEHLSPAEGWNILLDEISKREANIDTGLSYSVIREIIEGTASHARKYQSGLGPIFFTDLEAVFTEKMGYPADENAIMVLQRLPGLASIDQQDGSRQFIDSNFADASKAGELIRYVSNPYDYKMSSNPKLWQECISDLSVQMLALKTKELSSNIMEAAVKHAKQNDLNVLSADLILSMNFNENAWSKERAKIQDVVIPNYDAKNINGWGAIIFEDIIIKNISFDEVFIQESQPKFINCIFGNVYGVASVGALPKENFVNCDFETFEKVNQTNASIRESSLPAPVKVCFTILKKLYFQPGAGRQYSAFTRGLSNIENRYVDDILKLLKQEGLVIAPSNRSDVWLPVRSQSPRVKSLVLNRTVTDIIIEKSRQLL